MKKIFPILSIAILLILASCHGKIVPPVSTEGDTIKTVKPAKLVANIYVENSGSMDGYVTEDTEFKDVLGNLLIKIKHHYSNPNLYFINTEILQTKLSENVMEFIQQLSPKTMHVGNTGSSNINSIFRHILERTNKDTVSVLISDCVYSIQGADSKTKLNDAKNLTMDAFLEAKKTNPDLAVLVMQCQSGFNGYYYDRNNKEMPYKGNRPYYIFIMGKYSLVNNINQIIDLTAGKEGVKGLMNKYMISSHSCTLDENTASIITSDYTNAAKIKQMRNGLGIEEINIDKRQNTNLRFAIAVDSRGLFVDESYLMDCNNYEVTPSDYKVVSVSKVNSNSPAYGDCTQFVSPYAVVIQSNGTFSPDIDIKLKYKLPKWIYDSTIEDDSGFIPASNKSFGLSYMMEGIFSAFFEDLNPSKSIFELKFDINEVN